MPLSVRTAAARAVSRSLVLLAGVLFGTLGVLAEARAASEPAVEGPARPAGCWLGLAQTGGTGLFDLPLAEAGCPWRLRVGVGVMGFTENGYLLADDAFTQLAGMVQVAASLGSHLETSLQFGGRASRAVLPIMGSQSSDTSLLSLGEIVLTVKLHTQWGHLVHAAVRPVLRVHSGPDDLGPDFRSADLGVDLLGTVDLQRLRRQVPLRLHWLVGYIYDRSSELLGSQDCMAAGSAQCLATRLISTAAYDIGQPRMRLAIGADAPFALHRNVTLGPLFAYHADIVVGDGDPVLQALLHMQGGDAVANNRVAQWLTLGALLHLPLPMTIEAGMRIGLQNAGYAMGAKLNQLSGYGALTWELDLAGGRDSASPASHGAADADVGPGEPLARTVVGSPRGQGTVTGVIRDALTGVPLPDAVVRFVGVAHNALLADNRGEFRSAPLAAGAVLVEGSRGDHLTSRQVAWVRAGESVILELKLPPVDRPALGRLSLELRDEAGGPLLAAAILSRDGQSVQLLPQLGQPTALTARVPAGPWTLRVDATGYLSREQTVVLPSGGEQRLSLPLLRRPAVPRVQLGAGEVLLGEPLEFQPGTAAFSADSGRILDEVIDLLVHHPELHLLRIEHQGYLGQKIAADDAALLPPMMSLWEQQVIAVRDYLVQRGVSPERVVAQVVPLAPGHGKTPRIVLKVAAEPLHPPVGPGRRSD